MTKRGRSVQTDNTPLPVLLAHVLLDINRAFERAGEASSERPNLVTWANLLRAVPDEGITASDLVLQTRVSRRIVQAWVRRAKQHWLEIEDLAPRGKFLRLTAVGRKKRDAWGELIATTEREWSERVRGTSALRAALAELVAQLELELPHYPMTYGGSDWSVTGGTAVPAKVGPPSIPAHGTDWVPVLRGSDDGAHGLPLHALVSQALLAFTIDFEEQGFRSIAASALLTRAMPTRSVPLDALPDVLGVVGNGKTALERHGIVRVTGDADTRVVTLTPVGEWIVDNHTSIVERVTRDWTKRYGDDTMTDLTSSLAAIDAQLDRPLPDYVLVRHSVRDAFRDISFIADDR